MNKIITNRFVLIVVTVSAVLAGIWLGYLTQNNNHSTADRTPAIQGAILPRARALKDVHLQSTNNKPFTINDFKQHWTLIFIGYTNCPDVCPNTLSVLSQVDILMHEQNLAPPQIIFISIDPQRDKPELIEQYVKYFNKDFIGITGDERNLALITKQMSAVYAKAPGADGVISGDNYLMDHSSSLILVNPKAQVQSFLTAPHSPMQIIDSIIRTQVYYNETK